MFKVLKRLFGSAPKEVKYRAFLADCEDELQRLIRMNVYFRTPRDRATRESLLRKAASAGLTAHDTVRRLDFLDRLIDVLDIDPSAEVQDRLLTEAREFGLDEHSGIRAMRQYRELQLLAETGPQAIGSDQQGREVFFSREAEFKNKSGQLEIRRDGLTFSGEVVLEIAWDNIVHVAETTHTYQDLDYKAIALQEGKRRTPTKFAFPTNHDATYAFKLMMACDRP